MLRIAAAIENSIDKSDNKNQSESIVCMDLVDLNEFKSFASAMVLLDIYCSSALHIPLFISRLVESSSFFFN